RGADARRGASVTSSTAEKPRLPGSLNANRILSQWITFEDAKRVTIHPGKVEIGQGILTALAQITADELDVSFERVHVKAAATVEPEGIGERKLAGRSMARLDLADKIFGVPRFIQDLRMPGMRFARVVRPNARGAKLVAVPPAPAGARIVVDGDFLAVVCDT